MKLLKTLFKCFKRPAVVPVSYIDIDAEREAAFQYFMDHI